MTPVRVMLDTDLRISFLLSSEPAEAVVELFRAAGDGAFELVISRGQLQELGIALRNSPLLQNPISADLLIEL